MVTNHWLEKLTTDQRKSCEIDTAALPAENLCKLTAFWKLLIDLRPSFTRSLQSVSDYSQLIRSITIVALHD